MRHRTVFAIGAGLAALLGSLVAPTPAGALPVGNQLVITDSTDRIVTGDTWSATAQVQDLLGQPVAGAAVWTGIVEPSVGCGADLTAAACTKLATTSNTSDSNGQVTLSKSATLDTFVVFYLSDSSGALDASTGKSLVVRTHNKYDWTGPAVVTLKQYAIGNTPYVLGLNASGNKHRLATGAGSAGAPRTEVSTDGGTTWRVIARGTRSGVFPITGKRTAPVDRVNLMASKAGTYSVRLTDGGGTFEDPGVSDVVTLTVTARSTPEWLKRTNDYRSSLGLAPVADNPVYDAAIAQHVHWMNIHNQLAHAETPGSAGYTQTGNEAAAASDLAYGRPTATNAVDGWIGAPFHASCLLNAYWAVGGFALKNGWSGEWCHSDLQTLDLATGKNGPVRSTLRKNYAFPSSAMKVPRSLILNSNEAPDPVAGCASRGVGPSWTVPVIFRVARPPSSDRGLRKANAVVKTKSGKRLTKTCLLTGTTYNGPDAGSTQIGRLILGNNVTGRWAIVLIKSGALKAGRGYTATLTDGRLRQRTSFTLARR